MKELAESFNVSNIIVSQVNPFVVPFQEYSDPRENSYFTYKFNKFLDKVRGFIFSELRHRMNVLAEFGILPFGIQQILGLASQNYYGNVTIIPRPKFFDYFNILHLPRSDE